MHYIQGKGYFEASGAKVCSKRQMALNLARLAGYENDSATFTRLVIENRVSRQAMNDAFRLGRSIREKEVAA